MRTLKNNMTINNNKKRTSGRDFQMIQIKHVIAFVVMPRFGTDTHVKQPKYRQKIEVVPIDNKALREQSDFFADSTLSQSKKAKLWKAVRKQGWEKNVNEAWNIANKMSENFPTGDINILPIYRKTSMKIAA